MLEALAARMCRAEPQLTPAGDTLSLLLLLRKRSRETQGSTRANKMIRDIYSDNLGVLNI